MTIFWIGIFILSLIALIKGADWALKSSERIGLALGMTPFVVGVVITGIGTSLPELVSSFFAIAEGAADIVSANAIGSNIANILLVVGTSAIVGKRLIIDKDLINLDLPILAAATALFVVLGSDGMIALPEAVILLVGYIVFIIYSLVYQEEDVLVPERLAHEGAAGKKPEHTIEMLNTQKKKTQITTGDIVRLIAGILGLVFGAQYLIQSVVELSTIWGLATGVIAITAIAIGTSLPELIVSSLAALKGKSEVAVGNIFGSNAFNILVVIGLPGLFSTIPLDTATLAIGVPFLVIATILFILSGISRKIHLWEGGFYLLIYIVFMGQLFGFL